DYDRDGFLDLFVCNYVSYEPNTNPQCGEGEMRSYCHPTTYNGDFSVIYRNNGDGTFSDTGMISGVGKFKGKALGVAFADYDQDGYPDVFVANDSIPNFLFHNKRDGTFEEVGFAVGVAYSEDGRARAGMGADFGDYDNDGHLDLIVTNFTTE